MTVKEYLSQARWLDQKINADLEEVWQLRQTVDCISSPGFEHSYNATRNAEAPYTRHVEKIMRLEEAVDEEIDRLVDLKAQIRQTIASVPDISERLVLEYRYTGSMTWEQIGSKMGADPRTVRRWHDSGLCHVEMPENPIMV